MNLAVVRDINAFALMVQALSGKLTPPEPVRPGPSRVNRWRGEDDDAPPVPDVARSHQARIATGTTTTAQHPVGLKLTEVDASIDGANASSNDL